MTGDCIEWRGATTPQGHGRRRTPGKNSTTTAHRLAWIEAHGPIPDKAQVHHRCGNRLCVNVEHLELMESSADHHVAHMALRTRCGNGHPWTPENTYVRPDTGTRACRACRLAAQRRGRSRSKSA